MLGISDRIYAICEGAITGVLDRAEATQERLMKLMTLTGAGGSPADTPGQQSGSVR